MELKLNIINTIDIKERRKKIEWVDLDFSIIHSLQGNKELLELSFQNLKKQLIYG
jgi:hypothetical protein